jgi:hypothetical protein
MSATSLLLDQLTQIERCLDDAPLGLVLLDRIGDLARCTPDEALHKGVTVQPTTTANLDQTRNRRTAYVSDGYVLQLLYETGIPGAQKARRNEALVLEEQIRKLLTGGALDLANHLRYVSSTRGLLASDGAWWLTTMSFTAHRSAILGG